MDFVLIQETESVVSVEHLVDMPEGLLSSNASEPLYSLYRALMIKFSGRGLGKCSGINWLIND